MQKFLIFTKKLLKLALSMALVHLLEHDTENLPQKRRQLVTCCITSLESGDLIYATEEA